jgi:Pentapeptide repeats (8 copies)
MRHWRQAWLSSILPVAVVSGALVGHSRRSGPPTVKEALVPNLQGAHLAFINLAGSDLRYGNLADADLRGADLRDAELCGADLSAANLTGTNLSRTHLEEANLSRAVLGRARLVAATLFAANPCGADLRDADLRGAQLRGACYDDQTLWPLGFDPEKSGATRTTSETINRFRWGIGPGGPRPERQGNE